MSLAAYQWGLPLCWVYIEKSHPLEMAVVTAVVVVVVVAAAVDA